MKIHAKKKATQRAWKTLAQKGLINKPDGNWGSRSGSDSMTRNFSPQRF